MPNDYYSRTFDSQENTLARAEDMKQEFDSMQSGFDKLPKPYTGSGTKGFSDPVRVGSPQTADDAVNKAYVEGYASGALQVGTSVSTVDIGLGNKSFTIAEAIARAWGPGTQLRASAVGGGYMVGTVITYASGVVTIDMDYTNGTGSYSSWVLAPQGLAIAVTFSSGSAATPGLQVDGQSGDGLYSRSPGDVSVATGEGRRMSFGAVNDSASPIALPGNAASNLHAVPKQQLDTALTVAQAYTDSAIQSGTYSVGGQKVYVNPGHLSQILTDGASISWDCNNGQIATVTLGGNRSLNSPTNLKTGSYVLYIKQDATGSRTLSFGSAFKWAGGVAPVLSTSANAIDIATFVCDGTNLYGTLLRGFA